jgi:hypothetical protein
MKLSCENEKSCILPNVCIKIITLLMLLSWLFDCFVAGGEHQCNLLRNAHFSAKRKFQVTFKNKELITKRTTDPFDEIT